MINLPDEVLNKIDKIKSADIIIGIPSYKCANTIGYVVKQSAKTIKEFYPSLKAVIVNSDGNSPDNTIQAVLNEKIDNDIEKIAFHYSGIPGKGSALKDIFKISTLLKCKVLVILDSDLRNINTKMIRNLIEPILSNDYDMTTPLYVRHKYDGTITNSICYPLTSALYGIEIRQPIGGEMGFSGKLVEKFITDDTVWETDIARFGIDIWMTTTAINNNFRISQALMGTKIHDVKDPGSDLGPMFREVIGTAFSLMKKYEINWKQTSKVKKAKIVGEKIDYEIEEMDVNVVNMINKFKDAFNNEKDFIKNILLEDNYKALEEVSQKDIDNFDFPDELWVKIVYNYSNIYCNSPLKKNDIINSLIPIYFGRTASFVKKVQHIPTEEAEDKYIKKLKDLFIKLKPYLIDIWNK